MTILKDFYCTECGEEAYDVEVPSCDVSELHMPCSECRCGTSHKALCNGGLNSRYRFNDWNAGDVEKRIHVTKSGACYGNPKTGDLDYSLPVTDNQTGVVYQDRKQHQPEALREKRARIDHTRAAQRGHGKIVSTARSTSKRAAKGRA